MKKILLFTFIIQNLVFSSQPAEIVWDTTYSNGLSVDITSSSFDNSYVFVSNESNNHSNITKIDTLGNIIWSTEVESIIPLEIHELSDSSYLFLGWSLADSNDIQLKLDSNGGVLWSENYKASNAAQLKSPEGYPPAIYLTTSGAGYDTIQVTTITLDGDSVGQYISSHLQGGITTITDTEISYLGDDGEEGAELRITGRDHVNPTNNWLLTRAITGGSHNYHSGSMIPELNLDEEYTNDLIAKPTKIGTGYARKGDNVDLLLTNYSSFWGKTFAIDLVTTDGDTSSEIGRSIISITEGAHFIEDYLILGALVVPSSRNPWLIKTNFSGDTLWTKLFGYDGYDNRPTKIIPAHDGGYIMFGCTDYENNDHLKEWIVKLEESIYNGPVWHVATTGSDVTGDGSELNPFASINLATGMTHYGDTILVAPGTYTRQDGGTVVKKITF